ncbi:4-hydroxythreonine-4-phosphate dehydrogenase PdxA [Spirosoma radiotolerans]|uniref:4-hydroxythreonine-4-phosphate dehydrogenase n=1 Tax=Spirosoma radiotolerans TaxID=1379870 RepID=A0A0E3V5R7_9BACT|nr:4-hydroxythreonine-4-phosphate dehydrogenase PdxA [Spirosoma radiotolerans]AKD54392.1 4-hydroxythreonine-4-phosphate dehydrogenase [Spirosoma radiotolerans]
MEQRQSEESNPHRMNVSDESTPDQRPGNKQLGETGPTTPQQAGSQPVDDRQETPQRENRNGGLRNNEQRNNGSRPERNRDGGPRDGGPRDGGPRDGGPRDGQQRNGAQNQRDNRNGEPRNGEPRNGEPRNQNNRQNRDERPAASGATPVVNPAPTDRPERGQRPNNQRPKQQREGQPTNNPRPVENRQRDDAQLSRNRPVTDNRPNQRDTDLTGAEPHENTDQSGQTTESAGRDDRLVIGISLGDFNGIGPEVILKALQYNRLQKICTPVIYGSMRILNRYRNLLNLKDWNLNGAQTIGQISHKLTNVITCWPDQNQEIQPGQVTPEAGQAALACLQRAVDDLKAGKLDALVTAPINKNNIQSEEFKFPGHTEYLAEEFGVTDNLMFLVSQTLRVGVVTGHVPLGRVRQNVTRERIAQKLTLMMQSLKQDFGIEKPKIAVLGLNPHAGEEGLLGTEENEIIKPLITEWRNKGQLVFGPYPADGFFGTRAYSKFDAVLAMYHDQGLIPFKAIAFEEGVNFTAGMPAVRTSPDHGTAYDIAGKDLADETSMLQAIYTAIDVARNRKEFLELEAGALK